MLIPLPYLDAAVLFAKDGPLPFLWLDGRYLVATDRAQLIALRLDETHTGPAVALPLDIGTDVTILDGMIMSELGLHVSPAAVFPDWRKVYRRTKPDDPIEPAFEAQRLERVLRANELLGGGQIAMQAGGHWQSLFVLGGGKAHVLWMPLAPHKDIPMWDV